MNMNRRTPLKRSAKPIPKRSKSPAARERARRDAQFQVDAAKGKRCVRCCTAYNVSGHHIVHKTECHGRLAFMRHDRRNGLPSCLDCHNWFRAHPKEADEWMEANLPERWAWVMAQKSAKSDD